MLSRLNTHDLGDYILVLWGSNEHEISCFEHVLRFPEDVYNLEGNTWEGWGIDEVPPEHITEALLKGTNLCPLLRERIEKLVGDFHAAVDADKNL